MGKYIIGVALILFIGLGCGFAHYSNAAQNHQYGGDLVLTDEEHDAFMDSIKNPKIELLEYTEKMKNENRIAFSFLVRATEKGYDYGEYLGNSTEDNARNIAISVSASILVLVIVAVSFYRWRQGRATAEYYY